MNFDGYIRQIALEIKTEIESAELLDSKCDSIFYEEFELNLFWLRDELKLIESCTEFGFEEGIKDQFPFVKFLEFASKKYENHTFGKRLTEWKRGTHSFASIKQAFLRETMEWMRFRAEQLRDEQSEEQFEKSQGNGSDCDHEINWSSPSSRHFNEY